MQWQEREPTARERDNHPFLLFGVGGTFSSPPLLRCPPSLSLVWWWRLLPSLSWWRRLSSPSLSLLSHSFALLVVAASPFSAFLPSTSEKQPPVEPVQTIKERSATEKKRGTCPPQRGEIGTTTKNCEERGEVNHPREPQQSEGKSPLWFFSDALSLLFSCGGDGSSPPSRS